MAKFSGTAITGAPLWMIPNPKNTDMYVYTYDGKVHVVNSSLAMGTALNGGAAMTNASGNGGEYYDNKIILPKEADVAVYQIWNTTLVQNYWTGTLGLTALSNTTYPSINGVEIPNHMAYRHTDNKCYFCDVADNRGILSYIKTKKTTAEGDTDDSSVYNALDFPYGWYPTCITSFGKYLLIALIEGISTAVKQKPAKLALWNTYGSSFEDVTPDNFADPLITAVKNVNGTVYVFSGSAAGGCSVWRFLSVNMLDAVAYLPDAYPPFQGAVDHLMTRTVFGTKTEVPSEIGVVYALGSIYPSLAQSTGLHGIIRANDDGAANPHVTALKYFQQNASKPQPITGWKTDTPTYGLDKLSTTYQTSILVDEVQRIGRKFTITRVQIPFIQAIAANMVLTVKIYFDGGSSNTTIATINNTNYSDSERNIVIRHDIDIEGRNDFYLQLEWSGSALLTVEVPITISVKILEDT